MHYITVKLDREFPDKTNKNCKKKQDSSLVGYDAVLGLSDSWGHQKRPTFRVFKTVETHFPKQQ